MDNECLVVVEANYTLSPLNEGDPPFDIYELLVCPLSLCLTHTPILVAPPCVVPGSVLCAESGLVLGKICEVFGPITNPFYVMRWGNAKVWRHDIYTYILMIYTCIHTYIHPYIHTWADYQSILCHAMGECQGAYICSDIDALCHTYTP